MGNRVGALLCFIFLLSLNAVAAEKYNITGKVSSKASSEPISGVEIFLSGHTHIYKTDDSGSFIIPHLSPGVYYLNFFGEGFQSISKKVEIIDKDIRLKTILLGEVEVIKEAVVEGTKKERSFGSRSMESVGFTEIYESKKTDVVVMDEIQANKASNNAREIYSKVPGLNIWSSDCGGLQLDIGGRGLSPKRTASFNVRQNGYDISADALGYPESYYTPPAELTKEIQIVRGGASLQYGTQIGGMVNYVLKEPAEDTSVHIVTRQSFGSNNLINSSNLVSGTEGKWSYVGYYHYKRAEKCANRPNSGFNYHLGYANVGYQATEKINIRLNYTHMSYNSQQPGGLTDDQFKDNPYQSNRERNWFKVRWNLPALLLKYKISENTHLDVRNFALFATRQSLGVLTRIDRADVGGERNLIVGDFTNFGQETRLLHKYQFKNKSAAFLFGYRAYFGKTINKQGEASDDKDPNYNFIDQKDSLDSDYDNRNNNIALFTENMIRLSDTWSVTPGARYEYIKTTSEGYYKRENSINGIVLETNLINEEIVRERSVFLLGLGTSYRLTDQNEFYLNLSQNFKSINFSDLRISNPSFVVDPNLKDERGFSSDIGARGFLGKAIRYDVSFFYLHYSDRIGDLLVFDNRLQKLVRQRTNVSDSRNYGVESLLEWNITQSLAPQNLDNFVLNTFVNFSYTNAKYINSNVPGIEGKLVELVPPITTKYGFNTIWKDFEATFLVSYVAKHYTDASNAETTPDAVGGIIPSYTVLDAGLAYNYNAFRFEFGVNNITNKAYFTRRASSYPGPGIITAAARTFYLTVQLEL